jgi:hypothetical protein
MFEIQLLGLSEALGFAIGTGCIGYMTAGIIATGLLIFPVLLLTYCLHQGVSRCAKYLPADGTYWSRWLDYWRKNRETAGKTLLCVPYGFVMVLNGAFNSAITRGTWESVEPEEGAKGGQLEEGVQPFWRQPLSAFQKRFGPMFEDFTDFGW